MDIKWKKSRCAVSALCFVLGLSLLLTGAGLAACGLLQGYWDTALDALKGDYQDTAAFRRLVEHKLADYLERASGSGEDWDGTGDQSLLYTVARNGKTLSSNTDLLSSSGPLPEGFNFRLFFDGEQVTVEKDGETLDIYGDGYYRPEENDWFLPGYRNLPLDVFLNGGSLVPAADTPIAAPVPADEGSTLSEALPVPEEHSTAPEGDAEGTVTVCLAAAADPVYWGDGLYGGSLYGLVRDLREIRAVLLRLALIPAAGLALFAVYLFLRRAKAQADRAAAWVTGHIWLEIKLLLLIPLALALAAGTVGIVQLLSYGWAVEELFFALPAFWCCYLYVNDLRYNGASVFRNTLCGACIRLFRTGELRRPVQRRMARRAVWQFALSLPFVLFCAAQVPYLYHTRFYYGWRPLLLALLCLIALALVAGQVFLIRLRRREAEDLGTLLDRIQAVQDGKLSEAAPLPRDSDLLLAADALDGLEAGMRAAVAEQTRSERMKVELISNVSHDLKTPLTSIISYAGLLSQEDGLPEHVRDYIRILNEKAGRLSTMVKDVFDVSKAASGSLPVKQERLDLGKLLRQTLADMAEEIGGSGLVLKTQLPEDPVPVLADGDRLYRVFQNLLLNALKYALPGSRVYLTLAGEGDSAVAVLKNISRDELPAGVDFTERFVRGDESRTDGGSGLGLSIARTFTEACGGAFRVETDADLFTASVTLPLAPEESCKENEP